jgi:FKBP-type peptidyl-prolyl cis-trans isomerase 2
VSLDVFGEGPPPVGAEFSVRSDDGTDLAATVTAISDDLVTATVDFNHPLAGKALTFTIELVEIVSE